METLELTVVNFVYSAAGGFLRGVRLPLGVSAILPADFYKELAMKSFPNVQRKLRKAELRLVTDESENSKKNEPTLLHISRWSHLKEKPTGTACGKKNFKGLQWVFIDWMWNNGPICQACKVAVKKFGDFYG